MDNNNELMCLRVKHSEQGHYLKSNLDESKVILYKIKMKYGKKDILKKIKKTKRKVLKQPLVYFLVGIRTKVK